MEDIEVSSAAGHTYVLKPNGTWEARRTPNPSSDSGFRKVPWGSSSDLIRQIETAEFEDVTSDGNLIFKVTINTRSYGVLYILVSGILVRAKYVLLDEYINELNYLAAADDLREFVTSKYGESEAHNEFWSGSTYRDDPSDRGRAVGCGELAIYTTWNTADSTIVLAVTGENFETSVSLEYASVKYSDFEDQQRRTEILDNF